MQEDARVLASALRRNPDLESWGYGKLCSFCSVRDGKKTVIFVVLVNEYGDGSYKSTVWTGVNKKSLDGLIKRVRFKRMHLSDLDKYVKRQKPKPSDIVLFSGKLITQSAHGYENISPQAVTSEESVLSQFTYTINEYLGKHIYFKLTPTSYADPIGMSRLIIKMAENSDYLNDALLVDESAGTILVADYSAQPTTAANHIVLSILKTKLHTRANKARLYDYPGLSRVRYLDVPPKEVLDKISVYATTMAMDVALESSNKDQQTTNQRYNYVTP